MNSTRHSSDNHFETRQATSSSTSIGDDLEARNRLDCARRHCHRACRHLCRHAGHRDARAVQLALDAAVWLCSDDADAMAVSERGWTKANRVYKSSEPLELRPGHHSWGVCSDCLLRNWIRIVWNWPRQLVHEFRKKLPADTRHDRFYGHQTSSCFHDTRATI